MEAYFIIAKSKRKSCHCPIFVWKLFSAQVLGRPKDRILVLYKKSGVGQGSLVTQLCHWQKGIEHKLCLGRKARKGQPWMPEGKEKWKNWMIQEFLKRGRQRGGWISISAGKKQNSTGKGAGKNREVSGNDNWAKDKRQERRSPVSSRSDHFIGIHWTEKDRIEGVAEVGRRTYRFHWREKAKRMSSADPD